MFECAAKNVGGHMQTMLREKWYPPQYVFAPSLKWLYLLVSSQVILWLCDVFKKFWPGDKSSKTTKQLIINH